MFFQNLSVFSKVVALFLILFQFSCLQKQEADNSENALNHLDSQIIKTDLTTENSVLLQNLEYTTRVGKTDVTIEVALKKDSTIALKFNFYQPFNFTENKSYQKEVMDEIVKDFNPRMFKSVHLGRLIYTGDLCLEASENVLAENWDGSDYRVLKSILDSGAIVANYASFFEPYDVSVSGVTFEKAFLTESSIIRQYSKVVRPEDEFPPKILDAITWVLLN